MRSDYFYNFGLILKGFVMKILVLLFLFNVSASFSFQGSDTTHIGPYSEYYENGNIKIEGTYSDKKTKEGKWQYYFSDGKVQKIEHYKRGSLVGEFKEFFPNGQLKTEGNYSPYQTKKEGVWKEYYETGQLQFQAQYHSGELCGIYLMYYLNGNVSLKGEYDYFKYTKRGDWIEYYEDGSIKRQEFYNSKGILEKQSTEYYPNGTVKQLGEHDYVTGKKDGKWVNFFESGDTMSISYFRKGLQVGTHIEYFENGSLKINCEYNFSGQLNGLYEEKDSEGNIISKGEYSNGEKTGKWLEMNEMGELKKVKY